MPSSENLGPLPGDVLVVEDDPLIALGVEDTVLALGVPLVRTASSAARALEMIAEQPPDFAILDIGLRGETSFSVAERLAAMNIPFVFVTGYSATEAIPAAFMDRPRLTKPYTADALAALLKKAGP